MERDRRPSRLLLCCLFLLMGVVGGRIIGNLEYSENGFYRGLLRRKRKFEYKQEKREELEQAIDFAGLGPSPRTVALLLSGSDQGRHRENLSLAYQTCLEQGLERRNIFILDGRGKEQCLYPANAVCSRRAALFSLGGLAKALKPEDKLVVYLTGHGDRQIASYPETSSGFSTLRVPGPDIAEPRFANELKKVKVGERILIADQCYASGFTRNLSGEKWVGVSSTPEHMPSNHNTFPRSFFGAFRDSEADLNGDGKVSIGEAFDYAEEADVCARRGMQKPQLRTNTDHYQIFLKE